MIALAVPALAHQEWIVRTWGKAGTYEAHRHIDVCDEAVDGSVVGWYILDRGQECFLPVSLEVLTLKGNRVKDIVAFVSPGLFERFGLPMAVPAA